AQNYSNFRAPVRALAPGVSVVNFHYAYPDAVHSNYGLGKAIAYDETGFLGRSDDRYRRQAWNFMLAGGSIFDALDYSFSTGHEDGSDAEPNGPGGGSKALRAQIGILARFLGKLPLADLAPDTRVVKHAGGVAAQALSIAGRLYALYLDGDGPSDVTLDLPAGEYLGAWMDTTTGSVAEREKFRHAGGDKAFRTPDFHGGIALRLERTGR
ncbi:MAG: hypothetical protein ACHQNV_08455, partial [Vicinamibacteria bacterium]